jgi:HAD superfamily hydrolase (TIGR01490 family)
MTAPALASSPATGGAQGRIAALFDIDNTLLPGATSERLVVRHLIRHRHFSARAAWGTLVAMARHARIGPFHALRLHRPYLRGWRVDDIDALGAEVFATEIAPRLARRGIARVREHQEQGHLVALLSGAPPFLTAPLARYLAITDVLATPLAVANDRYTGELQGDHPYGIYKALLAQRFARERGLDLAASYAYADHHSDVRLLSLVGHPVCVNPTPRLRQQAQRFGWPVEEFR